MDNNSTRTARAENDQDQAADWLRPAVQVAFLLASVLIGLQFHGFIRSLAEPSAAAVERPPAVDGFLPISSLMSLVYLIKTGVANRVHPAGLVIFSLTLAMSFAFRRGFCSWVCPVGTISEYAWKAGRRLFGRNFSLPRWADLPLRNLKHLLLAFFGYVIVTMSAEDLRLFIHGPYNRIADVKMYLFFAHAGTLTFVVLAVLFVLSMLFKNFWCRYLCPYGSLLGLVSRLSPTAVRRDDEHCTGCGRCARACPNRIAVHHKSAVRSLECMACYDCVNACPVPRTLRMAARTKGRPLRPLVYAAIILAAFFFAAELASTFNYWQSDTPVAAYRWFYHNVASIGHPSTGGYGRRTHPRKKHLPGRQGY